MSSLTATPSLAYATSGSQVGGVLGITSVYSPSNYVPFLNNRDSEAQAVADIAVAGNLAVTASAVGAVTKATASVLGF